MPRAVEGAGSAQMHSHTVDCVTVLNNAGSTIRQKSK